MNVFDNLFLSFVYLGHIQPMNIGYCANKNKNKICFEFITLFQ